MTRFHRFYDPNLTIECDDNGNPVAVLTDPGKRAGLVTQYNELANLPQAALFGPGVAKIGGAIFNSDKSSYIKFDGARLGAPNIITKPTVLVDFTIAPTAQGGTAAWRLTPTGARDTFSSATLKYAVPGGGAGNVSDDYDVSADLSAADSVTLYVYGNRPTGAADLDVSNNLMTLLISTNGNFTSYYSRTISPIHYGLNVIRIPLSAFTPSGTPNWATVNKVRFRLSQNAAAITRTAEIAGLTYGGKGKPTIVITNDDSRPSMYSVLFPLLKKWGMRATSFVIAEYINTALGFTEAQMREMMDSGIEIGLHDSINITDHVDGYEAAERYSWVKERLQHFAQGRPIAPCLAYPQGQFAGATPFVGAEAIKTQTALSLVGIKSAYAAGNPYSAMSNVINYSAGLMDIRKIPRIGLDTSFQLAAATTLYNDVKASGGAAVFMSHVFGSGYGAAQYDTAAITTLIDMIGTDYQAGLVDVVTASEFAGYFS